MGKAITLAIPLLVVGLFMAAFSAGSIGTAAASDPLASLLWKARPLVVLADQIADSRFQRQIAALEVQESALAAYDIKLLKIAGDSSYLRHKLGLPVTGFAVALVGKDGGVKKTWRNPVSPERIFALIDTMPMRKDEVQRRKPD